MLDGRVGLDPSKLPLPLQHIARGRLSELLSSQFFLPTAPAIAAPAALAFAAALALVHSHHPLHEHGPLITLAALAALAALGTLAAFSRGGVLGPSQSLLHHDRGGFTGLLGAAQHNLLLVLAVLHLQVVEARRQLDVPHRVAAPPNDDAPLIPLNLNLLCGSSLSRVDDGLHRRLRLVHGGIRTEDLHHIQLPVHRDGNLVFLLDVTDPPSAFCRQRPNAMHWHILDGLCVAEAVMHLRDGGLGLLLLSISAGDLQEHIATLPDALHLRPRGGVHALQALGGPELRLLRCQLDRRRNSAGVAHAFLEDNLPLIHALLVSDEQDSLRLPHDGEPREVAELGKFR
mmetsp:Transcript_44959/g.101777  ORF Transcript_44959/g.101777 Transcript_44959/m.101777 type:complete len:344 (+) Transcript_44959:252-1283(+)